MTRENYVSEWRGMEVEKYLAGEPLYNVLHLQAFLPLLNILFGLILAGKHREGNSDARRVLFIDHGRVARGGGFEGRARLRGEVDDLATPACVPC